MEKKWIFIICAPIRAHVLNLDQTYDRKIHQTITNDHAMHSYSTKRCMDKFLKKNGISIGQNKTTNTTAQLLWTDNKMRMFLSILRIFNICVFQTNRVTHTPNFEQNDKQHMSSHENYFIVVFVVVRKNVVNITNCFVFTHLSSNMLFWSCCWNLCLLFTQNAIFKHSEYEIFLFAEKKTCINDCEWVWC